MFGQTKNHARLKTLYANAFSVNIWCLILPHASEGHLSPESYFIFLQNELPLLLDKNKKLATRRILGET
jgi:hypothetical protein